MGNLKQSVEWTRISDALPDLSKIVEVKREELIQTAVREITKYGDHLTMTEIIPNATMTTRISLESPSPYIFWRYKGNGKFL